MQSINFDTGYKTYAINQDESKTITVHVADQNLYKRLQEVAVATDDFKNEIGDTEPTFETLESIDKKLKEQLNYAFGSDVSSVVFGDINCFAVANDNGECVLETFLNAFMPIIEEETKKAAKAQENHIKALYNEKTSKYIAPVVTQIPQQNVDLSKLTDDEKIALIKGLRG